MKTKINGKVLLGVFLVALIAIIPLVFSKPVKCNKVTIHVQDSVGKPIRGARVIIYDPNYNQVAGPQTVNGKGDTTFCLLDGFYKARAYTSSADKYSDSFRVPGTTIVTIVI